MSTIIVAGGGIAGLVSAALLSNRYKDARIVLVEAGNELGGLLRSFDYHDAGKFDYGTHYLMESGIRELDEVFEAAFPPEKRRYMTGYATDLSGIYWNGQLQKNTPFIDLRNHSDWAHYLADFIKHVGEMPEWGGISDYTNASEYFQARFGEKITHEVVATVIRKIFRQNLEDMYPMGAMLTPLQRVTLLDQGLMQELVNTQRLSQVVAFPEQRELPREKQPTLRASYPLDRGIGAVIDGFRDLLARNAVDVRLSTMISELEIETGAVSQVRLKGAGEDEVIDCDHVVWAGGLPPLAKLLAVAPEGRPDTDPPLTTVLTHMLIDREVEMGDLYYFYCYQPGLDTFRVTNYRNLSANSDRKSENPVTVEMIFAGDCPTVDALSQQAENELRQMGVLPDSANVAFCKTEVLNYGFPLMTTKNAAFLATLRSAVADKELANLTLCGALSEPDVFFQKDVLVDLHAKISALDL